MSFKLTVRHGSRVDRESFDDLEAAIAAARRAAEQVRSEGPLDSVSVLREYASADRVAARLEISRGAFLRSVSAGVDVMGDGSLVAFAGGVRRRPLQTAGDDSAFEAVRRELG